MSGDTATSVEIRTAGGELGGTRYEVRGASDAQIRAAMADIADEFQVTEFLTQRNFGWNTEAMVLLFRDLDGTVVVGIRPGDEYRLGYFVPWRTAVDVARQEGREIGHGRCPGCGRVGTAVDVAWRSEPLYASAVRATRKYAGPEVKEPAALCWACREILGYGDEDCWVATALRAEFGSPELRAAVAEVLAAAQALDGANCPASCWIDADELHRTEECGHWSGTLEAMKEHLGRHPTEAELTALSLGRDFGPTPLLTDAQRARLQDFVLRTQSGAWLDWEELAQRLQTFLRGEQDIWNLPRQTPRKRTSRSQWRG